MRFGERISKFKKKPESTNPELDFQVSLLYDCHT